MKLCGLKEKCFENGECWGHLDSVICKNYGEDKINGEIKSICFISKEEVLQYTTEKEYKRILINKI
jgi:hypothetical protein